MEFTEPIYFLLLLLLIPYIIWYVQFRIVLGGWVFGLLGIATTGLLGSLVTSVVGADRKSVV